MKKLSKILILVLVVMTVLTSLAAITTSAATTFTTGDTLYLKPNSNWTTASARFAAYFFNSSSNTWVSMTEADTDGYYKVTVPSGDWTAVIFCRMNPSTTANNWSNKWNQTGDLTATAAGGKNCFTLPSSAWDSSTTTWSVFCDGNHTWDAGSVTTEPTCSQVGVMKYTCTKCSSTTTEDISTIDHTWNESGEECTVCGAANPDFCAHTNQTEVNTATCTTAGKHYFDCDDCDEILNETDVEALGHNYENGVCSRCGGVIVYFINGSKWSSVCAYAWTTGGAGLSWPGNLMAKTDDTVNGFDVYCIELDTAYGNIIFNNNNQGSQTADLTLEAGKYYDLSSLAWYDSLDTVPEIDPLSTDIFLLGTFNGWSAVSDEFKLGEEGGTVGYLYLELEANTTYEFKLIKDGSWYSYSKTITDTTESGLTFSTSVSANAKLTTQCSGTYVFVIDGTKLSVVYPEHSYDEGTVTEPTCTEAGYTTYTCTACGASDVVEGEAATGHTEETVEGKDATCTEAGLTDGKKCSVCGETILAQETIDATGHSYNYAGFIKSATCTEDAEFEIRCKNCEKSFFYGTDAEVDEYLKSNPWFVVKALGHDLVDVDGKDATCTEAGYSAHKDCSRCDYTEGKETVDATGHTWDNCECTSCGTALSAITDFGTFSFITADDLAAMKADGRFAVVGDFGDNGDSHQFKPDASLQFVVPANVTVTITGHSTGYGVFDVYLNGVKTSMAGTYTFVTTEETKVVIVPSEEKGYAYAYLKGITLEEIVDRVISADTEITFGNDGNWSESVVDFSGITVNNNGGSNSQVKEGSFQLELKAGAVVVFHGYNGYTSYTLSDGTTTTEEITDEYYTYYALVDTVLTYTPVNGGKNYLYGISIKFHTGLKFVAGKDATCTEEGYAPYYACDCCDAVVDVIEALGHSYTDGYCTTCGDVDPDYYFAVSIPEALETADGTKVEVSGTVSKINTAWSDQYGNITVTIVDSEGNSLYIYRMKTNVTVGDIITIKGVMGTYNGRQIAAGSTATITGHDTSYDYIDTTVSAALELTKGTNVIVSGYVKSIDTAWSTQYKNMCITLADEEGNTIYVYRLATKVGVGDYITVKGTIDVYNGKTQIGSGSTAEIVTAHVCSEYTEATCTEAAKCVVCGKANGEALGHTEETVSGKDATCTETGLTEGKKCSVCGETLVAQETIDALGHTEETVAGKAPTCTQTGLTDGKKCSVCGETLVAQETIDALGHTEETVAGKAPTCKETGLTDGKKCSVCGETLVAQTTLPVVAHTYDDKYDETCNACGYTRDVTCDHEGTTVTLEGKAATCTEAGLTEGSKCTRCEEILVAQEVIEALGHTEETVAGKAPTCTETGLTEGKKCSVCGTVLVSQTEIEALGHTEETVAGKAPTCTEAGLTDGKRCSVCGETLVAQETVDALGHNEETVAGKAPTCTEAGLTDGKRCSVCGETLVAQEEIPATGHTYVEGKCECGAEDPDYVAPHEHNFVEGKCECGEVDPDYVAPQPPVEDPDDGDAEEPVELNLFEKIVQLIKDLIDKILALLKRYIKF